MDRQGYIQPKDVSLKSTLSLPQFKFSQPQIITPINNILQNTDPQCFPAHYANMRNYQIARVTENSNITGVSASLNNSAN